MKYIGYRRCSTVKQEKVGNGLEAQEKAIRDFVAVTGGELIEIYTEVESGKEDGRPVLAEAIRHADLIGARLLVGKLDRLSRSLHFLLTLQKEKVDFVVADLQHCDKFTVSLFGAMAEREREMIVTRTREGLERAKARGVKLGSPDNLTEEAAAKGRSMGRDKQAEAARVHAAKVAPMVKDLIGKGHSLNKTAEILNERGILTARGNAGKWSAQAVKNVLDRVYV